MRISAVASSISSGSAMAGLVSGGARLGRGDLSCGLGKRRRGSREEMRETETVKVSNFALIHMVTINRKSSAGFVARRDECAESDSGSGEWGWVSEAEKEMAAELGWCGWGKAVN
jgi:hypothetical protein